MANHPQPTILHLADHPEDTRLLSEQLMACGMRLQVARASDVNALRQAMRQPPSMLIVDLPLPWAEADLVAIRATQPDLPVVFRWGHPGNRHVDRPSEQIGRAVARALALHHFANADAELDQAQADHVRLQHVLLRLGRLDFRDFEGSLRAVSEAVAQLFAVARVSIWEVAPNGDLHTLDAFDAAAGMHEAGQDVADWTRYRQALEESVAVVATDAQDDPRLSEFASSYLPQHAITSLLDSPIRTGGQVVGVICIEHTGSRRRWSIHEQEAAAAIAHLLGSAFEARERHAAEAALERARKSETLGQLAAQLAHDFNNRLMVIAMLAAQIEQEATTPSQRDTAQQLLAELVRARDKVRHLMAGKADRAAARPSPHAATDLANALRSEQTTLRRLLGQHRLQLLAPAQPVPVMLSREDLREILTNLVTNARDAMPDSIGTCTLRLQAPGNDGDGMAHLLVEDTGEGLSREAEAHLFEPFFTTKGELAGSGHGLSSVQRLVQQIGGRVRVSSRRGHGTTVDIALPVAAASAADAAAS